MPRFPEFLPTTALEERLHALIDVVEGLDRASEGFEIPPLTSDTDGDAECTACASFHNVGF